MSARLEVETESARGALLENLPALRERLAEQGVKIERFDVDLADRGSDAATEGSSEQRDGTDSRRGDATDRKNENENLADATANRAPSGLDPHGRLDVVI